MDLLAVLMSSFFISALLMPKLISFAKSKGFFDDPGDNGLKVHRSPIPFLGGVGIFIGFIVPVSIFHVGGLSINNFLGITIGSIVIISLGLWDDLRDIHPYLRIGGQVFAAGVTIFFNSHAYQFPLPCAALPLCIIYILGSINSVNLFDGLDGLAGGVVSISLIGFTALFYFQDNGSYALLSLALLGAVWGFLCYNFNPARIFMGDNGSTFLGYILAVLAIGASSSKYQSSISLLVPVLLIGLPVIDTALAIARRILKRRPVFIGDRSHLYDRLVDSGFSVRTTVAICYTIQICLVSVALYLFHRSGL